MITVQLMGKSDGSSKQSSGCLLSRLEQFGEENITITLFSQFSD